MRLKYKLKESDLILQSEYEIEQSASIRKRRRLQRIKYVLGFGLLAIAAYRIFRSPGLAVFFGAVAVVSFLFYPWYVRWLTRRNVTKIVRERSKQGAYDDRVLSATADGLEQSTGYAEFRIDWGHVEAIADLADHLVLTIQGVPLIVVPKDGVVEGDVDGFVKQVNEYIENAAADQSTGASSGAE